MMENNSIIKQIETARQEFVLGLGGYPRNLYLGWGTYRLLQEELDEMEFCERLKLNSWDKAREVVCGLHVYTVDAGHHLEVA